MTQTEYEYKEQKKLECYRELREQDPSGLLSIATFEFIFDRAFALGKQTEIIAQEDIEKAAEAFATPPVGNGGMFTREQVKGLLVKFAQLLPGKQEKDAEEALTCEKRKVLYHFKMAEACKTGNNPESDYWIGYSKAIQELFGFKGEPCVEPKDADTVIQGWVARDEVAIRPALYTSKPLRQKKGFKNGYWSYGMQIGLSLDPSLFPDLTWDDEPEPVEIIIKRKKK